MTQSGRALAITKELTANDTGDTGAHQAGMHIPKDRAVLSFFPPLDSRDRNPRCAIAFYDDDGMLWEFSFIYYNNRLFGGTRDEYRLTRMTPFIRKYGLRPGDQVILRRDPETELCYIEIRRRAAEHSVPTGRLNLGGRWREIKI